MTKQQLIEDNMKLVFYVINKYYPKLATNEDIAQCGMLGLCQAAETWDETRSAFSTYAVNGIRKAIVNEVRRQKRHNGIRSLDDTCKDSEDIILKNTIVGDEDVDYIDIQSIYKQLNNAEKEILKYRMGGFTTSEIAKKLGCSRQNVSGKLRKIIRKWKEYSLG